MENLKLNGVGGWAEAKQWEGTYSSSSKGRSLLALELFENYINGINEKKITLSSCEPHH